MMAGHAAEGLKPPSQAGRVHGQNCLECGAPMRTQNDAIFCTATCRVLWNNRRKSRGAELYDLYMAHRHERGLARAIGLLTMINRLASVWREQDRHERAGRRSWTSPEVVVARAPYLRSRVVQRGRT